jgi:hypothetical protein
MSGVLGPLYLDELGQVSSGDRHWIEVHHHHSIAVYRPDVSLRLAWGLKRDEHQDIDGWTWPDRSITRHLADAFWQGSLVARWTYLVVDGGRCYLPDPQREYTQVGESPLDVEAGPWQVKASEIALTRVLNELAQRPAGEFDRYLRQSGAIEIAD